MFHHLPSVGPKQLCALAHLGCINKVGTLRSLINVGLCLLIQTLFIQGYFVIREATFINLQFSMKLMLYFGLMHYFDCKKILSFLEKHSFCQIFTENYSLMNKNGILILLFFKIFWRATFIQGATFIDFCGFIQGYFYLRGYLY